MIRTVLESVMCPTEFLVQCLLSSALLNKRHDLILSSHFLVEDLVPSVPSGVLLHSIQLGH